jgi:tetratricopeptide (TPR) repeat protein
MRINRGTAYFLVAALAVAAFWGPPIAGQNTRDDRQAEAALQTAINKEWVEGNLQAAIEQYKKVVERFSNSRATAAKALAQMGQAYEKLGNTEARKTYERLLRDYADQTQVAADARRRLAALSEGRSSDALTARQVLTDGMIGDRAVWTGPNVDMFGTVSPDGRFLTYIDWGRAGNLMLHDFLNGSDRALTNNVSYGQYGQAQWSAISKDGKQVAFEWYSAESRRLELRVGNLLETGAIQSRAVLTNPEFRGMHTTGRRTANGSPST